MKSTKHIALALLTFIVLWAAPAFGQSDRGTITGSITDPNGAVVPNAQITATDLNTGEDRVVISSDAGTYTLAELKASAYKVSVEAQGFKTSTLANIQLGVQMTRRVDIQLEIGEIGNVVTVSDDTASVIQSDTPVRQTNVNERQVRELPLQVGAESGGRTPLAFIFLDSNVNASTGTTGRGTDASNFRVSGGQGLGTEILIDGASTRRAQNGTFFSEVAPGPNAFQEFTISTSTYSAEFGSSSGGVVNFTLKSGGNDFHGELYDLVRNEKFEANTFLNNSNGTARPRDNQNDFGFNIGGPIYLPHFGEGGPVFKSFKDRAFFFFNYEGYRFRQGENVFVTVPTVAMRRGDFSELLTDPYVLSQLGGPIRIYNPRRDPAVREAIPGNRLDTYLGGSLIDPAGLALLQAFPNPTGPGVYHNYLASSISPTNMNNEVGKVDFVISDKQRVSVSYSFRKLDSIKGFGGRPAFTRFPAPFVQQDVWNQFFKSHFARIQHDYTLTPNLLNHFNIGFTRYDVANMNFGSGLPTSSFGIPAGATQNTAFPRLGFPGYGPIETSTDPRAYQDIGSTFFSDHLRDNTLQFSDFVTYVKGRHTLKVGGDLRFQQFNVSQQIDPGGTYNFRNDQTAAAGDPGGGWPIASLITGATEFSFVTIRGIDPGYRYFTPDAFITDDIKVTSRLTLNLGVRYEIPYPRREAHDRYRGFDPIVNNPAVGRVGAIVSAAGTGALQSQYEGLVKPDYSNIAPRTGFAYTLNSKTVVRGGAGLYYSPILYGFGGNNTIEATIGYSSSAVPYDPCPAFDPIRPATCRRPLPNNNQQSQYFLSQLPLAPATDPNGQFIGSGVDYFNKDYKTGRTLQYSLDIQRELPARLVVSLGYIGHRATRLRSNFERLNALPLNALKLGYPLLSKNLSDLTTDDRAYAQRVGFTLPANGNAVFAGFNGNVAQALRPFPQYGNINSQLESNGRSWYNALQFKLDRRFAQGVQFGLSYTFSKLITDASEDLFGGSPASGVIQNPYDRAGIRSVSPNNPYHVIVFNYLYEFPFGKGKRFLNRGGVVDKLIGGFQLNGIQRYQSGLPLVISTSDPDRVSFLSLVGFNGNLRPNLTGQPIITSNSQSGTGFQLVNRAAFGLPPNYQAPPTANTADAAYAAYYADPTRFFGTASPVLDHTRVLPFLLENLSLLKKTRLTETLTLELGAEAFNVFNRHRYNFPSSDLRDLNFGNAGVINDSNIYGPRVIQLRGRLTF